MFPEFPTTYQWIYFTSMSNVKKVLYMSDPKIERMMLRLNQATTKISTLLDLFARKTHGAWISMQCAHEMLTFQEFLKFS